MLFELLLGRIGEAFALVFQVDHFAPLLVLGGVLLGVGLHLVDLFLAQSAGILHRDLVLLAGALVLGGDGEDAVHIDVERHLDLRHAAR